MHQRHALATARRLPHQPQALLGVGQIGAQRERALEALLRAPAVPQAQVRPAPAVVEAGPLGMDDDAAAELVEGLLVVAEVEERPGIARANRLDVAAGGEEARPLAEQRLQLGPRFLVALQREQRIGAPHLGIAILRIQLQGVVEGLQRQETAFKNFLADAEDVLANPEAAQKAFADELGGLPTKVPAYEAVNPEVILKVPARDLERAGLFELPMESVDKTRLNRVSKALKLRAYVLHRDPAIRLDLVIACPHCHLACWALIHHALHNSDKLVGVR